MNKKLKNRQIIFVALTTYQLFVSDAYANYIYINYNMQSIIIFMRGETKFKIKSDAYEIVEVPYLNNNVITKIWQRLYYSGRLFSASPLYKIVNNICNGYIFVFNDYYPISKNLIKYMSKSKTNTVILVDEGIGTYAKTKEYKISIKNKIKNIFYKILGSPMIYNVIGESKEIRYAIVGDTNQYKDKECSKHQIVLKQNKSLLFHSADQF